MERSITLITLALLLLTPATAVSSPPDLCDEPLLTVTGAPYADTTGRTLSRWCSPHTDPPIWAEHVCCSVTNTAHLQPHATPAGPA